MGCGGSVPKVIIPNPEPNTTHKALIKKKGVTLRDYEVYKDFNTSQKWLFIRRHNNSPLLSTTRNFSYFLENFVRSQGNKEGECLISAKEEDTEIKIDTVIAHEDSDSSSDSADSVDWSGTQPQASFYYSTEMRWRKTLKTTIYADREQQKKIGRLKIKGKGKAVKYFYEDEDDEGDVKKWTNCIKQIKKMKYTLFYGNKEKREGDDHSDYEHEIPIKLKGKFRYQKRKLVSDMFTVTTKEGQKGGFKIKTEVHPCEHPSLALLVSCLCAEYGPSDILHGVKP
eukprot:TRINITY_DN46612_c0_g1_i1.p1 TRINITY_DN46612_c0_g1~~TRINITY_DN46612_c0_g1_i1.p1  ORF type:complete len:283 (-),score=33.70 TRINITY_DN46612_c0_g1_i1:176-1024(-)